MLDQALPLPARLLIGGLWVDADSRQSLSLTDPATEAEIGRVPIATPQDVDAALAAADKVAPVWAATTPIARARILRGAADLIRQRADAIARSMTREQGKILAESRAEVMAAADLFDWCADEGRRSYGRIIASTLPGHRLEVTSEPIGVVAGFTAWNFPSVVPVRKIAAALAAGCPIIIKPSEETPSTICAYAEALLAAGLPEGAISVLYGDPAAISQQLIASPVIRKIAITGSTPVGKLLAQQAAERIIPGTYELGGHSPVIVLPDADLDHAVPIIAASKFRNAGQVCVSPNRFFVHESIKGEFTSRMVAHAENLKLGNGLQDGITMGPLTNERRMVDVDALVQDAIAQGATLETGGARAGNRGWFYQPTVLSNVPDTARIMQVEPFGPVAPIQGYSDLDAALAKANNTAYGLAAYVYGRDAGALAHVRNNLAAGMVGINTAAVAQHEGPFGGIRDSGYGREGGPDVLRPYLTEKLSVIA